jgi:lysophospholipase L1-like esterase
MKAHPGQIGLVTISIGGNDLKGCASSANVALCLLGTMPGMKANITTLANRIRETVGTTVPILAITYPDVALTEYLTGSAGQSLVTQSVTAYQSIINPTFTAAYAPAKVSVVNTSSATGAFIPFSTTGTLSGHGTVPMAEVEICTSAWICLSYQDIHPAAAGCTLIAGSLKKRSSKLVP